MAGGGRGFGQNVVSTDIIHDRIHQGVFFQSTFYDGAVVNNAFLEVMLRVPTGSAAHFRWAVASGGNALGYMYHTPTLLTDGTARPALNFNGFSTNVALASPFITPTFSDPGTAILDEIFFPGGQKNQASGGGGSSFEEFVLGPGDYLGRLQNIAGTTQPLQILITWYEPVEGRVAVLG